MINRRTISTRAGLSGGDTVVDGFDNIFRSATGYAPYPWQRNLALRPEPASVIAAPTGSGKTEAVLLDWVWRRFQPGAAGRRGVPRRLVLALPMRVLVEQTLARIREALGRLATAGVLERPVQVYPLMGGMADDSWVFDPAAEAVLVGTIDMLLSRALNRGFGCGRSRWPIDFGLLNSDCLWVFDEIQLMDAAVATSCQLQGLRQRFGVAAPVRTVWMSATLERSWLETVDHLSPGDAAYAGLGSADYRGLLGQRLRAPKTVVRQKIDPEDAAAVARVVLREHGALSEARDAPSLTLALANTVDRALALYEEIQAVAPEGIDLLLLHSRFRPADRERLVRHLDQPLPPDGRIVVSTQVVEAGLDLDAGALVTDLAPWASMVQRAGRLNRTGKRRHTPARLVWLDPGDERLEELARPYDPESLRSARKVLAGLEGRSFAPADIMELLQDRRRARTLLGLRPVSLLLRAPDLLDLFDTDPTLDGDDPDVGRFIRVHEDLDVGVAWRDLPEQGPSPDEPLPGRAEVCPVPVWEKKVLVALEPWRWSYARRTWEPVRDEAYVVPGDVLLVRADAGGYTPVRGWTGTKRIRVEPVGAARGEAPDDDAEDRQSLLPGRWITLEEHTEHALAQLEGVLGRLGLDAGWAASLRQATRAHDVGKAHPEFQNRLARWAGESPPDGRVYAKGPDREHWRPPFAFRHEVLSALWILEKHGRSRDVDLVAYLAAAHHGKFRLTPRVLPDDADPAVAVCLGIREGDAVPEVTLDGERFGPLQVDLSLLRIGSLGEISWVDRVLDLRDRFGPFQLAYLEAILRAADQRASAEERGT
jgi:CRISPR-associated endonuclease/helicase Cas3